MAKIVTKRVYEAPAAGDGVRILVDRLWPRGMTKEQARVDYWAKEIAPSNELRRWYGHDPGKWPEFRKRYFAELTANPTGLEELVRNLSGGTVTFLFGSKELKLNNAAALKEYLAGKRG